LTDIALAIAGAALGPTGAFEAVRATGALLLSVVILDVVALTAFPAWWVILLGAAALALRQTIVLLDLLLGLRTAFALPGQAALAAPGRGEDCRAERAANEGTPGERP
jgi:hypothetical protein